MLQCFFYFFAGFFFFLNRTLRYCSLIHVLIFNNRFIKEMLLFSPFLVYKFNGGNVVIMILFSAFLSTKKCHIFYIYFGSAYVVNLDNFRGNSSFILWLIECCTYISSSICSRGFSSYSIADI